MTVDFTPFDSVFQILRAVSDDANSAATQRKAATGDKKAAVNSIIDTSDDPLLVKYRKDRDDFASRMEAAKKRQSDMLAAAQAKAESLVPDVSESELSALRDSYLEKRKQSKSLRDTLLMMLGGDEDALATGLAHYGIVDVISSASGSTKSNAETIVRKRLASATVSGSPVADSKGKVSFTTLSQVTDLKGVTSDDLRTLAAKASGVESVKDIPSETTVEFSVTVGDHSVPVTITTA